MILCFTPDRDKPGKHDYSRAFRPLANELVKRRKGRVVEILQSLSPAERAKSVLAAIEPEKKLDTVAFCTHGLPNGLPQMGFDRTNVDTLTAKLSLLSSKLTVILYACSTGAISKKGPGEGDGSFADLMRDALCEQGASLCRVFGHTTAGRALENPYVRLFEGLGSLCGGHGGTWLVSPKAGLWRAWKAALNGDLGYRFPWMTIAEIHQELSR